MANESDIFSADQPTELNLGLNDLVGEGRKYKDPDELAKAYANIEAHARTLERENAEVRAKLDIKDANTNPDNDGQRGQEQVPNDDNRNEPPNKAPTPDNRNVDFRSQIREEVKALSEQDRAAANIEAAAKKMVDVYGSTEKANEAVQNRARELDVSVDWLRDSASRSPQAFYASMGIDSRGASSSTPSSGGGVHLENRGGSNAKNFEYFDRIRKEDPKTYFSAATQGEMLREAKAQGGDFYKR